METSGLKSSSLTNAHLELHPIQLPAVVMKFNANRVKRVATRRVKRPAELMVARSHLDTPKFQFVHQSLARARPVLQSHPNVILESKDPSKCA